MESVSPLGCHGVSVPIRLSWSQCPHWVVMECVVCEVWHVCQGAEICLIELKYFNVKGLGYFDFGDRY